MTQYTLSTGLPSATYRDFVLSYVGLFDHYVLCQTGQYDYTAYVWGIGKDLEIEIYREVYTGSGFSQQYRWRTDVHDRTGVRQISVFEPMYAYSSEDAYGVYAAPSISAHVTAAACAIVSMEIAVCVVFRFLFKRGSRHA